MRILEERLSTIHLRRTHTRRLERRGSGAASVTLCDGVCTGKKSPSTTKDKNKLNGSISSRINAYAGPTPLGPDGLPLKSCLASSPRKFDCKKLLEGDDSASTLSTVVSNISESIATDHGALSSLDINPKLGRSVSFGSIEARIYELALGDHPFVSSGPPVTIGWKYKKCNAVLLDEYEMTRGPKLNQEQLKLPPEVRKQMLLDKAGVSIKAIKLAAINAKRRQNDLMRSIDAEQSPNAERVEEVVGAAKRRFKRFARRKSKDQEETELWEIAHKAAIAKNVASSGDRKDKS